MLIQKSMEALHFGLNAFLAITADRMQLSKSRLEEFPPVFILGSPRCGSTLIFQTLAKCLDIGYTTNRLAKLYGAPGLAIKLGCSNTRRKDIDFNSEFGKTKGDQGPSEFTKWWYRFFQKNPVYTSYSSMSIQERKRFRRSVENIVGAARKPVLFKNLYTVARLDAIINIFPESLFVVISRSELEIAHSLLEARKKISGDYSSWFSLPIREMVAVQHLVPEKQVLRQVRSIYREIEDAFSANHVSSDRILRIRYEDFCLHPEAGIAAFRDFIAQKAYILDHISKPPESFQTRTEIRINRSIYSRLKILTDR